MLSSTKRAHRLRPALVEHAQAVRLRHGERVERALVEAAELIERRQLIEPRLMALGFATSDIDAIVEATGPKNGQIGFTFSDLTQRLIPTIVLDAYPNRPIEAARAVEIAREMQPTPSFTEIL